METLLLLGAIAAGIHAYSQADATIDQTVTPQQINVHVADNLDQIDWSQAGNFRTQSTPNSVQWVMLTGANQ